MLVLKRGGMFMIMYVLVKYILLLKSNHMGIQRIIEYYLRVRKSCLVNVIGVVVMDKIDSNV